MIYAQYFIDSCCTENFYEYSDWKGSLRNTTSAVQNWLNISAILQNWAKIMHDVMNACT